MTTTTWSPAPITSTSSPMAPRAVAARMKPRASPRSWHPSGPGPGPGGRGAPRCVGPRRPRPGRDVALGFVELDRVGPGAEITAGYVIPDHRGRGLGSALVRAAGAPAGDVRDLWICADQDARPRGLYDR